MIPAYRQAGILKRFGVFIALMWATAAVHAQSGAPPFAVSNALAGEGTLTIARPHRYADVVLEGDTVSGTWTFAPQAADVGKSASLYVVASITEDGTDSWFSLAGTEWRRWNRAFTDLPAATTRTLAATETLDVLLDQQLFAGDYRIYAGYRTADGPLLYSRQPFSFAVQSGTADTLQRFSSEAAMEAYLKAGLQQTSSVDYYLRNVAFTTTTAGATLDSVAGTGVPGATSTTNLQEAGVDEADTVKVDGKRLYTLKNCALEPCLEMYELHSADATATPASSYSFGDSLAPDGMYLVEDGILGQDMLVTVAGQYTFCCWISVWGWQESRTELQFLNISAPGTISSIEKLSFDGALVASRRVGNTLYLVTRYTPAIEGYQPFPVAREQELANADLLSRTSLPQLLPHVTDSRDLVQTLVESKDCYLPTSTVDDNPNPSIITITSIDLKAPTNLRSTCFLGGSETLYMTTDALYLATTSWNYTMLAVDDLRYSPNHTTAIHKFALAGGAIEYRGSGAVEGHLGWTEDKKSFRMGENGAYLNVVTSIGDTWGDSSSTTLTVLREAAAGGRLETVSELTGIGKPGEQLYAARFFGARAYLVTFRVVDPLYVVDLSSQENPRIAGELEIAGYSDYLHPVGENLLLGIGKDAVPDDGSLGIAPLRGAWYQGVKVALFDVANPAAPREIDSLVLGKRGTESEVLWDHHAFSYLPATAAEPARFAIPVQLHDRTPQWPGFNASSPAAWYDYTHTGLYSFEVSAQGVTRVGSIIARVNDGNQGGSMPWFGRGVLTTAIADSGFAPWSKYYGDRSVLMDDAVYYLHEGTLHSALWGQTTTP